MAMHESHTGINKDPWPPRPIHLPLETAGVAQKPVKNDEDHDGAKAATAEFACAVTGENSTE